MNIPDIVNGLFEAFGCLAVSGNIVKLYKDKSIKGLYWPSNIFFTSWGYWNTYYYWHLTQWFSLIAGSTLALVNTVWVLMAIYYIELKGHLRHRK